MEIRDPVHGFVHLTDAEKAIIDSIPFQRLRNIKQLGMSHYVYPSSSHTRFEHSIGTLYVANQMFDVLIRKHGNNLEKFLSISGEEKFHIRLKKTLRLASLLHDIGHPPFSHATEELFPENMPHERMSAEIIKTRLEGIFRKSEIARTGIQMEDVIFLIYPEIVSEMSEDFQAFYLLRDIISGDIDADRIDYLTRDSHHTGVIYGKFDYIRLIDTITITPFVGKIMSGELDDIISVTPEPRIGIEFGGLHTIEGLLLARYFMFLQVYFHHIRRIYDIMLTKFLRYSLPEGHYPSDIDEYLKYNDVKILSMIRDEAKSGSCKEAKVLAKRLLHREHPKRIFQESRALLKFDEFEEEVKNALQKKFDIDPVTDIYVDSARKTTSKPSKTEFYVIQDEISENLLDYWSTEKVVELKEARKIMNISECSDLLNKLPDIEVINIYASIEKRNFKEAEKICRSIYNQFKEEEGVNDG